MPPLSVRLGRPDALPTELSQYLGINKLVSILNLKGPFTWCDSGCDKTATFVNIFSDVYTTHSEMKSLS